VVSSFRGPPGGIYIQYEINLRYNTFDLYGSLLRYQILQILTSPARSAAICGGTICGGNPGYTTGAPALGGGGPPGVTIGRTVSNME